MNKIIWRMIPGDAGYEISNNEQVRIAARTYTYPSGKVINRKARLLKKGKDRFGNTYVLHKRHKIHTLPALKRTFCKAEYYVNETGRRIHRFNIHMKLLGTYKSLKEAAFKVGVGYSSISCALNGWSKTAGGFVWRYEQSTISNEKQKI